jgi:hypothetical protein
MVANHTKLLILSIIALAILTVPVANVHARPSRGSDPNVTAVHTGGTGGGDGDVIFNVTNVDDPNGIVRLTVTETDNSQNAIRSIQATPANWVNQGLVLKNGKAIQTTWLTCTNGGGCSPVTQGTFLNGFDAKMNGQAPYGWAWVLTDTTGATFFGTLSVS